MPVQKFCLGTQQNSFRKRSRTCAEVKGSLAHIHSHYALIFSGLGHLEYEASKAAKRCEPFAAFGYFCQTTQDC